MTSIINGIKYEIEDEVHLKNSSGSGFFLHRKKLLWPTVICYMFTGCHTTTKYGIYGV